VWSLDLLPLLREAHASGTAPLFYDQCHHTPEANRLIASAMYGFLLEHVGNRDRPRAPRAETTMERTGE